MKLIKDQTTDISPIAYRIASRVTAPINSCNYFFDDDIHIRSVINFENSNHNIIGHSIIVNIVL